MSGLRSVIRGENNFDFAKAWRVGLVISAVLVAVSVGAIVVRGLNLGVEFTGGVSAEVTAQVSVDEAREALDAVGQGQARVQVVTSPDRRNIRVQSSDESAAAEEAIVTTLAELGGVARNEVSLTSVSPSWGADVTGQAVRALVFFLVAITIYLTVRLELRMAIGAIVATVHDLVIAVGVYALFQFEVTSGTVIAFLMILGYSIYDTVVVFDKVKENEARVGVATKLTYTAVASLSMNQVLMRSINTSITSLLPVVSILVIGMGILGAVTLGQFGIALAVGLVVGTYSSIMVAAPVVVFMKEREPRYQQLRERMGQVADQRRSPVVSGSLDDDTTDDPAEPSARPTPSSGASKATGARPTATVIPPRPRKKGRKR